MARMDMSVDDNGIEENIVGCCWRDNVLSTQR